MKKKLLILLCLPFKWYRENGNIKTLTNYKKNIQDGEEIIYHSNGVVFTNRIYQNGLLWNVNSLKNEKGADLEIGSFKNGTGTLNYYKESGNKLDETANYISGKLNGEAISYFFKWKNKKLHSLFE